MHASHLSWCAFSCIIVKRGWAIKEAVSRYFPCCLNICSQPLHCFNLTNHPLFYIDWIELHDAVDIGQMTVFNVCLINV